MGLMNRLSAFFRRSRLERELDDELQHHIELKTRENIAAGMSAEEARYAAIRAFGGVQQKKEQCRDADRLRWVEDLIQDVRFGLRQLRRNPGFTAVAVLTLALGIGANTAMFSVIDAVLLRPLPYKNAARLTVIWQSDAKHRKTGEWFDIYKEFEEWSRSSRSFEKLSALTWATKQPSNILLWHGKSEHVLAIPVSLNFFSMLGVSAQVGRTFSRGDLNNPCTVVLAHGFWQSRLGGSPGLVGKNLDLGKKPCMVAGVMPKGFSFYPKETELWTLITTNSEFARKPWRSLVGVFGLLRPGVTRSAAQAELAALQNNFIGQAPPDSVAPNSSPAVLDLQQEFTWLTGRNLGKSLIVLFAAVVFVLLIACVNVANLLLGRASKRNQEFGIRAALGSGRSRLMRQLLTESVLLSVCAAGLGTLVAAVGLSYLNSTNAINLPPGNPISVNWQVLVFTAGVVVVSAVIIGFIPAWNVSRLDLSEVLKASSRISSGALSQRAGRGFVVAEIALSLVLLAGAGLLIESLARLASAPLGFERDNLLTAQIGDFAAPFYNPEKRLGFYDRVARRVSRLPGVRGVAFSPQIASGSNSLIVEGRPSPPGSAAHTVSEQSVSSGYFAVMGIPFLRGRAFDARDRRKSLPTAIVNDALAKEYFPNEDPVGHHIRLGKSDENKPWLTIVGVVGNVKSTTVFKEMGYVVNPIVYRPLAQDTPNSVAIFVRAAGKPVALASSVCRTIGDFNSNLPAPDVETVNQWLSQFYVQPRLRAILLSLFAGLALLLAAIGTYGVLSQSVAQRTHEIGIRMALGAQQHDVLGLVLRRGMILVFLGAGIGWLASLALTRFLASMLYGVKPTDPAILAVVSAVLVGVALLACYIPARRACKVDPMVALRYE